MKNYIIATTLLCSATLGAAELTVTLGGWSDHHIVCKVDTNCSYNERHESVGISYNNWQLMSFNNSYYRRSTLVAYNWYAWDADLGNKFNVAVGIDVGFVSGYTRAQVGDVYLGKGWSMFGLPKVDLTYKATTKYGFGVSVGAIPSDHGVVYTSEFIFKIKL